MAGYSGTPLVKKLGIKAGHRVAVLCAPTDFELPAAELPTGVVVETQARGAAFDVILLFTDKQVELRRRFAALARRLKPAGGLWIAWPKKASGVPTDVTEDVLRDIGLPQGLVDNKVCAVSDVWSGLRFVIRVENRPKSS